MFLMLILESFKKTRMTEFVAIAKLNTWARGGGIKIEDLFQIIDILLSNFMLSLLASSLWI